MPEQSEQRPSTIEATYKAREVEGVLDLYFYRPIGFRLARLFAKLKMTPAGVTWFGGLLGVIAGHLYYYRDLRTNIIGMAFLVFVSIYVHLTLRYLVEGSSSAICLLALTAGISHALQGAAADYYRSSYLYFVTDRGGVGLDSSSAL